MIFFIISISIFFFNLLIPSISIFYLPFLIDSLYNSYSSLSNFINIKNNKKIYNTNIIDRYLTYFLIDIFNLTILNLFNINYNNKNIPYNIITFITHFLLIPSNIDFIYSLSFCRYFSFICKNKLKLKFDKLLNKQIIIFLCSMSNNYNDHHLLINNNSKMILLENEISKHIFFDLDFLLNIIINFITIFIKHKYFVFYKLFIKNIIKTKYGYFHSKTNTEIKLFIDNIIDNNDFIQLKNFNNIRNIIEFHQHQLNESILNKIYNHFNFQLIKSSSLLSLCNYIDFFIVDKYYITFFIFIINFCLDIFNNRSVFNFNKLYIYIFFLFSGLFLFNNNYYFTNFLFLFTDIINLINIPNFIFDCFHNLKFLIINEYKMNNKELFNFFIIFFYSIISFFYYNIFLLSLCNLFIFYIINNNFSFNFIFYLYLFITHSISSNLSHFFINSFIFFIYFNIFYNLNNIHILMIPRRFYMFFRINFKKINNNYINTYLSHIIK